jgi:hypothetical protein
VRACMCECLRNFDEKKREKTHLFSRDRFFPRLYAFLRRVDGRERSFFLRHRGKNQLCDDVVLVIFPLLRASVFENFLSV